MKLFTWLPGTRTQVVGSYSALILTHWTTPRRSLWCLPQKVSFPTSAVIPSPFTPSCLESSCLARQLSLTVNFWPLCYHPVMSHEGRRNSLGKGSLGVRVITSHGGVPLRTSNTQTQTFVQATPKSFKKCPGKLHRAWLNPFNLSNSYHMSHRTSCGTTLW